MPDRPFEVLRAAARRARSRRRAIPLLFALASWVALAGDRAEPATTGGHAADQSHVRTVGKVARPVTLHSETAIGHLKQQGTYDSLAAAVTRARYSITRTDSGPLPDGERVYEALNPAEDFHASFTTAGVRVRSNGERQWQIGVELKGYGYDDRLLDLTSGTMQVQDNRIEITKHVVGGTPPSALVEWYVNTPQGLEQGFTLSAPPPLDAKSSLAARGRLRLVMQLIGDLHAAATADGQAISLNDAHGRHASSYAHLRAWDATGRELAAQMHVSGQEIALAIDDAGAVYPVTVDPTFGDKQFELIANDGSAFDNFGNAVAVSGNTAVVGAPDDDHDGTFQGSVYVFVRNGGTWVQQQKLTQNDDGIVGDQFGFSVAISGDTIVVGAPEVDFPKAGGVGFDDNVGAAYVYVRSGPL